MPETPNPIDVAVGRRVCNLRLKQGFNQSDLAKALGLTFQQVQKYEKGTNRISCSKLVGIANFLKVSPAYFLEGLAETEDGDIEQPRIISRAERRLLDALPLIPARDIGILADLADHLAA